LTKAMAQLEKCQVGSETDRPCRRAAAVKIRGIPFCEPCAREQKAYFTIGELTEAPGHPDDESVVGILERVWQIRRRRVAGDQEPYAA
jgi:hypothetical protein